MEQGGEKWPGVGEKGRKAPKRIVQIIIPASLFPESLDAQGGWGSLAAVSSPLAMMDFSCVCLHWKVRTVNCSVSKTVIWFVLFLKGNMEINSMFLINFQYLLGTD